VQAHEEPKHTNTNAPRSLDCIYLRPMDNAQGGHELLHLQTNKVVKQRNLTKIPITPSIIKQVHALAELDKMPAGLKITDRANHMIFDSAWIAGVDYDEDLFDDDDHNEEEDGDDNEDNEDEENYDEMDENDLADILQQPNEFQVPHETEEPKNERNLTPVPSADYV
jgi:Ran GTPase-activating protein (RanGAP) involved in mRNA processing and transport